METQILKEKTLGKLIAVHPTSPAFLQRAAVVAALAFIFFLSTLVFYLIWANFLYFLLATAFLIVQIFTMIGWWMQKRNAVYIYANGITYKECSLNWEEISGTFQNDDGSLLILLKDESQLKVPRSIHALGSVAHHIRERI